MGWPEVSGNGRKSCNFSVTHGSRRHRFASPIPARPEVVGSENLPAGSSGCPTPPCLARVSGGQPVVLPLVQTSTARKWSNDPTWCSRFWRVFPRVLELKMVFWGLGFHLAPKFMFI